MVSTLAQFRISVVMLLLAGGVGCSQQSSVPAPAVPVQSGDGPQARMRTDGVASSGARPAVPAVTGTQRPSEPSGALIAVGDTLYGTTALGGIKGTVFSFVPATNVESTIFEFYTGEFPVGKLVATNGNLFGVTETGSGTARENGEIFGINQATDKLSDAYIFRGGDAQPPDGSGPNEGLIYRKESSGAALLLGTTLYGGSPAGLGSIYEYRLSGPSAHTSTVLHAFRGGTDGQYPSSRLINPGGTMFYGTTEAGGATHKCGSAGKGGEGCGTVFSFDLASNTETVLHAFTDGTPGAEDPSGTLYDFNGELYGTTESGGVAPQADGTVFKVNATSGAESLIHSFPAYAGDGDFPFHNGFANVGGLLYGMTTRGGTGNCSFSGSVGCGTVFTIDPSTGKEQVLYSFQGGTSDGGDPTGELLEYNGVLYGTTELFGAHNRGTIFSITPQGSEQLLYSF
jgi:uncharacterized repeat protein (TIGR03803 family)